MFIVIAFIIGLILGSIGGFKFCLASLLHGQKKGDFEIKLN